MSINITQINISHQNLVYIHEPCKEYIFISDDEHVVHYAVDGDGDMNFSGSVSGEEKAIIRKESYWNVVADSEVAINNELDKEHRHVKVYHKAYYNMYERN